jgi:transcriptional antiterminator NusG
MTTNRENAAELTPGHVTRMAEARLLSSCGSPVTCASAAPWYALRLRSQTEKLVSERLEAKGIETWNPTFQEQVQWSDRKKLTTRNFFPGYLFVRCELSRVPDVLHTPGAVQILPTSLDPVTIPDEEIQSLKQALALHRIASPHTYVVGEAIQVKSGPLAGFTGIVLRSKGSSVLLNILEHAVSIHRSALKAA